MKVLGVDEGFRPPVQQPPTGRPDGSGSRRGPVRLVPPGRLYSCSHYNVKMFPLLLALLAEPLVTRPPVDPATLPLAAARDLHGSEVLITSPAVGLLNGTFDGFDVYDLGDAGGVERYLFVPEGAKPADLDDACFRMEVEVRRGRLSLRFFPAPR